MDLQNTINSFSQTNNGVTVFRHKITVPIKAKYISAQILQALKIGSFC